MPGPLTTVAVDIVETLSDDALRHRVGLAAKTTALEAAEDDLGGDRAFSGFRRVVPLKARYDLTSAGVDLEMFPEGLWNLAEKGRRAKSYRVIPRARRRRGRRRVAVMTPRGPRYSARITRSRGLGTLTKVERRLDRAVSDAIGDHLNERLGR